VQKAVGTSKARLWEKLTVEVGQVARPSPDFRPLAKVFGELSKGTCSPPDERADSEHERPGFPSESLLAVAANMPDRPSLVHILLGPKPLQPSLVHTLLGTKPLHKAPQASPRSLFPKRLEGVRSQIPQDQNRFLSNCSVERYQNLRGLMLKYPAQRKGSPQQPFPPWELMETELSLR